MAPRNLKARSVIVDLGDLVKYRESIRDTGDIDPHDTTRWNQINKWGTEEIPARFNSLESRVKNAYSKTEEEERRKRNGVLLISFIVDFLGAGCISQQRTQAPLPSRLPAALASCASPPSFCRQFHSLQGPAPAVLLPGDQGSGDLLLPPTRRSPQSANGAAISYLVSTLIPLCSPPLFEASASLHHMDFAALPLRSLPLLEAYALRLCSKLFKKLP
ncbi:hypothetical protein KSP40_PGU011258 [Platanthera guangdongensis]|uniref:Uncharacterized protein n=1 Tax=Platanthera guangdongensis TaxID=2320717 RepID=A0ABR2M9P1_9ASPA